MIVATVGARGDPGRSTVALNLGSALGSVVVDAGLSMADLPVSRGPDLHDVLAGRATASEAVREGGAVDLLPCGRTLAGDRAGDVTTLTRALHDVEREYGSVVVDCPPGTGAGPGLGLAVADVSVAVARPVPVSVGDALRSRSVAREFDAPLAAVVLPRADEQSPVAPIERLLGAPVVPLADSSVVSTAMECGLPVAAVAPESAATAAFERLADRVQRSCRS